jgi:hypothetical protein
MIRKIRPSLITRRTFVAMASAVMAAPALRVAEPAQAGNQ